ncbi:hypothetical protein [Saccharopolyspora sp. NPDC049357]|uniref:hypothetical protein n=1 Tax=Saccharopolyspora sp. NPDC049357 TaxID=3154507 RepID=UPI003438A80A
MLREHSWNNYPTLRHTYRQWRPGHQEGSAVPPSQLIDLAQGLQNQDFAYPRPEEFVR